MVEPVSYSRISISAHKKFSHWNPGVLFYFPSLSSCMLAFDSPLPPPPCSLTRASLHYVLPAVAPSGSSAPSFPVSRSLFASLSDLSSAAFLSVSGTPWHCRGETSLSLLVRKVLCGLIRWSSPLTPAEHIILQWGAFFSAMIYAVFPSLASFSCSPPCKRSSRHKSSYLTLFPDNCSPEDLCRSS